MIEITYYGRYERQPCHYGEYGTLLFWSEYYESKEIGEQIYALLQGWA